jgi:LmbE family N-acetylglucosaminyl deacetylase
MPIAVVSSHPDDEMLGLGVLLSTLRPSCAFIHVTDGAPRSGDDIRNAGCATWQEYALLRRREFAEALAAAGLSGCSTISLECPDQQAIFRIAEHAARLAALFDELRPSLVFTHAYEGGHPDHDATAAAVHAALHLAQTPFTIAEFAGYHAGDAGMECECFLENRADVVSRRLTADQSRRKRDLLNCYTSQLHVLAQFPLQKEPLRPGKPYDFSRPPHEGPLYYDRFNWGVDSHSWLEQARRAFRDLRIPCVC